MVSNSWDEESSESGETSSFSGEFLKYNVSKFLTHFFFTRAGDEVPYTTWGQAVAAFTMLCGILGKSSLFLLLFSFTALYFFHLTLTSSLST